MSEYIEVGQPLQFTDPNTPTRVGEIVENVSDIYNIPSPRLGMQVFVKNEKKSFVITSLKSKTIGGVDVPEAAVEAFEPVGAKSFTWNNDTDPSNMNDFVVAGVYDIKGEHTREDDNLPILNTGGGHTFNARSTVLDSSITGSGNSDDKCITQVLSFCNRLGQGEVYIRTGKGSSLDSLTWEKWSTLQRNVNVGQVDNLDNLKDNGIYSGVWTKGSYNAYPLTFVCIVINDYFVGTAPRRISQFVYGLSKFDGSTVYQSRVWDDSKNAWGDWEILNQKEIAKMISDEIKKVTDGIDPEKIDSIKDIVAWIDAHGGVVTAIYNAIQQNTVKINAEVNRAINKEQEIGNKLNEETQRATEAESSLGIHISQVEETVNKTNANLIETKKNIASSLHASSVADSVNITGKSDVGRTTFSAGIPAATTEKAGVMSAEDKKELQDINSRVGNYEETITLMSSDLLPILWDGTKMVSNTKFNTWIVPLNKGRSYKCTQLSYIYSIRTCNEYPSLGKELVMTYAGGLDTGTFVATDETRYLVFTVQTDKYDSSNYKVAAYGYGLINDFNDIESRVTIVEKTGKEVVQLKRDMHSRFGSNDRTVVLTSSDCDNIIWDGTKFSLPGSVDFNGFVVPIYPGERIIYQVDHYANNLRTTTEYPVVGSSDFVRKKSELNGYFTVQENEHYLFINCYTPAFTSYKVIADEGAISNRIISTFETSATRDSVGIVGKNSTEEIIFESKIPSATTEKAGVMSVEDKKELQDINSRVQDINSRVQDINSRVGSQSGTIILTSAEYNNIIWDGTKFVASNTKYNSFVIPITSGRRVVYNAKWANNACTLQNYPTIGSSERVRTRTELNGDFIVQDNERYLFLNTDVELHTSYTVTFSSSGLTSKVEALTEVQQPLYGKTIVCFGDSLTEFNGDDGKGYADYLAELTQANIIRGGVGGTQLATRKAVVETPTDYLEAYGAVDISNLVKAWANNEWTAVDNAVTWLAENRNDNNSAVIERLKANPIENTDIVIVFGGSNDCANGTFGSPNDTNPLRNTCGGINQIIDSILSVKPNMTIYFFTPIPRMVNDIWCDDYRTDQSDAHGSLSFPSLVKRIKECVEYNHIPCCDMYNTIGINRKNIYTYADDGVHPNHGYSILANKIYGFMLANRIWK